MPGHRITETIIKFINEFKKFKEDTKKHLSKTEEKNLRGTNI